MKKKIIYTDEPINVGERVKDFLPPPEELFKREKTVKVTLELSEDSLNYFKKMAKKKSLPYQRMLRNLVDLYVKSQEASR